tara:strand:+ start:293 stop:553 length:261 start_codon:yes stop_codon:yes gene_type:complete
MTVTGRLSWHSKTLQTLGQVLAFEERDLTKMPPGGRQFDVVCANLMFELLVAEKGKLASWLAPAWRGFWRSSLPKWRRHFAAWGWN